MDITLSGVDYRTGRLDAFKQLHVARRLAPVLQSLVSGATAALTGTGAKSPDALMEALGPAAKALATMSEADVDYIVGECLAVCDRNQDGKWVKVKAKNGGMMFSDIDMKVILQLVSGVVRDNLSDFFPDGLLQTTEQAKET